MLFRSLREDLDAHGLNLAQDEFSSRGVELAVERVVLADEDGDVGDGGDVVDRLRGFQSEELGGAVVSTRLSRRSSKYALLLQRPKHA